ncbi:Predicted dithiol-disulfide isomerase, DsbA family [Cryptosporangium aurantiacum]|uniref:Predicted dithiol-disulfide isomerase, DsbA family n=2 Tax=Cryptosporangium aurantiacum TaxID=134849 RepID=A0A1M7RKR3_9ACTN|nr:Predicted dithiol-disulfide isomerase, DsbA family [Cryptosporangium aurantiacum]
MGRMRVDIWSDIGCPWCYVGKRRFENALADFEHRDDVEVVYHSFELDPTHPTDKTVPVTEMLIGKFGMPRAQVEAAEARLATTAADEGLKYDHNRHAGNTFDFHRLAHWATEQGKQQQLLDHAYAVHFGEAKSVHSTDALVELAADAGLDPDEARAVLTEDRYADDVRADEKQARELGITGVPFYVLDGRYGVSGAQPTEVFAQALAQAYDKA